MVIALGSRGGAAGQVTSHLCLRPQGEVCHPNFRLTPGFSGSVPEEHNLGQPRFLGGATFPDCFLTGELSQRRHTHLTDTDNLHPRCVPIGS